MVKFGYIYVSLKHYSVSAEQNQFSTIVVISLQTDQDKLPNSCVMMTPMSYGELRLHDMCMVCHPGIHYY